jgi:major membrane immunogen (membrane-anchored lipoprotein)
MKYLILLLALSACGGQNNAVQSSGPQNQAIALQGSWIMNQGGASSYPSFDFTKAQLYQQVVAVYTITDGQVCNTYLSVDGNGVTGNFSMGVIDGQAHECTASYYGSYNIDSSTGTATLCIVNANVQESGTVNQNCFVYTRE